ncbi:MAG: pentapeptide repeat-containing protein [Promethearchaeota archaeon]
MVELLSRSTAPVNCAYVYRYDAGCHKRGERCRHHPVQGSRYCRWHLRQKGKNLERLDLSNAEEAEKHLCEAYLVEARLHQANLQGVQLWNADLQRAKLVRVKGTQTRLRGSKLQRATIVGSQFWEADLGRVNLTNSVIIKSGFYRSRMKGTLLDGVRSFSSSFMRADMRLARLRSSQMVRADFRESDLSWADAQGGKFQSCRFQGSFLYWTDFRRARFFSTRDEPIRVDSLRLLGRPSYLDSVRGRLKLSTDYVLRKFAGRTQLYSVRAESWKMVQNSAILYRVLTPSSEMVAPDRPIVPESARFITSDREDELESFLWTFRRLPFPFGSIARTLMRLRKGMARLQRPEARRRLLAPKLVGQAYRISKTARNSSSRRRDLGHLWLKICDLVSEPVALQTLGATIARNPEDPDRILRNVDILHSQLKPSRAFLCWSLLLRGFARSDFEGNNELIARILERKLIKSRRIATVPVAVDLLSHPSPRVRVAARNAIASCGISALEPVAQMSIESLWMSHRRRQEIWQVLRLSQYAATASLFAALTVFLQTLEFWWALLIPLLFSAMLPLVMWRTSYKKMRLTEEEVSETIGNLAKGAFMGEEHQQAMVELVAELQRTSHQTSLTAFSTLFRTFLTTLAAGLPSLFFLLTIPGLEPIPQLYFLILLSLWTLLVSGVVLAHRRLTSQEAKVRERTEELLMDLPPIPKRKRRRLDEQISDNIGSDG